MNKTAAVRSQARRAALYKCAAVDPAQVAGIVGMLGGGALAGSAATGDDQSTLKRIGKGALATGLAYGGYKAMTDPRWQQGIRDGASRLHDLFKRFAARLNGVASAGVKQAGAASAAKGLLRAAGKVKGGSGLQKALADGKIVLPPAMSTKALVHEALKGLRGPSSYGWPLPAYPFRGGRDKGLLDLLGRARFMGTASSSGGRMTTEEAIQLLRRLNGSKSVVGPQEAEALRKSIIPPKPVGVDLSGMKITKKSSVEEKVMNKTAAVRSQARRTALVKRAANGKAIGSALNRFLRRMSRGSADVLTGGLGYGRWGGRFLTGARARRLSDAQSRLADELHHLNFQKDILTSWIGRSNPNNWSFAQADGWGALSKSQKKVVDGAHAAYHSGTMARWSKPLDREIAALEKRRAARHDALLRVTDLLRNEQDWVHYARGSAAKRLAVAGGAGYGLHKLLGGNGDGEKKAAEAAYIDGFCKAAEAAGVDPVALYKQADIRDSLWKVMPDTTRGALVYHGLTEPGTLLPLVGTVGGMHQLAAALNPRRKASKTERALRGTVGLGLTAGGAYAMFDNDAKQAVRNALYRLVGILSKPTVVAKAANGMVGGRSIV